MSDSDDFDDMFGDMWEDKSFRKIFQSQRNLERLLRENIKKMIQSMKRGELQGKGELIPIDRPGIHGYIFHGVFGTPGALEGEEGMPEFGTRPRQNEEGLTLPETDNEETREPMIESYIAGNEFIAVVELPGVDEHDIKVLPKHGFIEVNALNFKTVEIDAPAKADISKMSTTLKNGILEIRVPLSGYGIEDDSMKFGVA
jgi:HSP20 family molecular chaperone IbpA